MTLEDFIAQNKGVIKHLTCGDEVLAYLEDLKTTRKALELACSEIAPLFDCECNCPMDIWNKCRYSEDVNSCLCTKEYLTEHYLKKAREQK